MFQFSATSQFDDLMEQIDLLSVNEQFVLTYTKSGDWGTYEGGTMTFIQTSSDSIRVELENKQVYLGSKTKSSSSRYDKLTLLNTLQQNKNNYYKDPDNIVFNNTFHYKIEKNGRQVSQSTLPMEPTDVVNMVTLNSNLKSKFFKEDKALFGKGPIKIKN
jgi:archaellin